MSCGVLEETTVENVIEIAASAEKVFDFVVDVRNEPQWNPQLLQAEMLTPEPMGVGTRFRVRFGRGVGEPGSTPPASTSASTSFWPRPIGR